MSFGFRANGRPSLSERVRGKSGDEILEELRKKLDLNREMLHDRFQTPPGFRRAGFPFDDDGLRSRERPDFRHRLQELAQQHPEFADSLRPWFEQEQPQEPQQTQPPQAPPAARQRTDSNSSQQSSPAQPRPDAESEPSLAHHGLRNTVDLGEAQAQAQAQGPNMEAASQDERVKRASSAPPAPDQPQRFVSRLDVVPQPAPEATPTAAPEVNQAAAAKPPAAGARPPQPQPAKVGSSSANVRQIPIFVEGRDEPVLARDDVDSAAANFGQPFSHHQMPSRSPFGHHQGFSRPHMGFPSFHARDQPDQDGPAHKRPFPQQRHQPSPPPSRQQPPRQATPPQQQPPRQPQAPQAPPAPQASPAPQPPQAPAPPPQQTKPKDPLEKVAEVRAEVDSLAKQVEEFTGTRQDKQYIYLDEMLTRELIKLDVIETEGRDDVRAARKETIRAIQQCISKLESKAGPVQSEPSAESTSTEAMEVEPATEAPSAEPPAEAMEVDRAPESSSQPSDDSRTERQPQAEAANAEVPEVKQEVPEAPEAPAPAAMDTTSEVPGPESAPASAPVSENAPAAAASS